MHVEKAAFDAARRGIPKLYSVTDATAASGIRDGDYELGSLRVHKKDDRVLLPDGTLAGSCLTQRQVLSVLRQWGFDWHVIGAMVSAIPADWIENDTLGNLAPGSTAHWLEIKSDEPAAISVAGAR